jgi:elongation factor 1-gamma
MAVSGTLYTYEGSLRSAKALIAAQYSGAQIKVDESFEFGKTNVSKDFLAKFPLGKVPAFESSSGDVLFEADAIAHFVANEQLRGSSPINQALIQQYIAFSNNEITPSACTWTYPCLGFKQYNKQDTEAAKTHLGKCFAMLDSFLLTRTFLVGERVTLADICLACDLVLAFKLVLDPSFRGSYKNVTRWFLTCVNQPEFKKVLNEVPLCEKMAQFDNKKYQELHPKKGKEGGKEKKEQPKKKETPKKKEEETAPEEPAPPAKKKNALLDLPKTSFNFDEFKMTYCNNFKDDAKRGEGFKYLKENFDKEGISLWRAKYNYDDFTVNFMAENALIGAGSRLDGPRKKLFGMMMIIHNREKERKHFDLECLWLCAGTKPIFTLDDDWNVDMEYYTFTKLDLDNADDAKYAASVMDNTYMEECTDTSPRSVYSFVRYV